MLRKIEVSVLLVLACVAFASAAQRQALKIVPDPSAAGIRKAADTVRVEWVQLTGAGSQIPEAQPLSGDIYYASAPAAGDLSKYRKLSSVVDDNALAPFGAAYNKRVTRFIPGRQGGRMGSGVYYVIAAAVAESGDTLYSDYLNLMVASAEPPAIIYPRADFMKGESTKMVSELAPLFQWKPVAGVPYYHVLLSDEPFATPDGKPNSNVNIIWQAITPNTRIAYGAPDPSNTIKASPPPLSPGKTYSWIVLNNYGNYSAFTSWDVVSAMDQVAGRFAIKADGGALKAPRPTAPARGNAFNNAAEIEFKWANIDTGASSYLLNIFSDGRTADFGMGGMGDFAMKMLVWEATVPRGAGDTLRVVLNAGGTLASGSYTWRVYALDSRGAAFTDNNSTSTFRYSKSAEGNLSVKTFETLGGVQSPVGFVELKPEVLDGSTMTPFLFYTNSNGALDNRRISAGVYRITAAKEGYCAYTSTVAVTPSGTASVQIPMSRPEAVLYGRALASNDSSALNSATVTAASEWGDTVFATTDGNGGFVLACRAADWVVTVQKPGFRASSPRRAALRVGDNKNFGDAYLERNQFTLSGVVRNSSGGTVVAARVRLLRGGVLVDEVSSTPQNGAYAFYVGSGVYTLTVEKPGFAMFSRSVAVAGTASQDVTLRGGAALVNGSIIGRSWVPAINAYANAPIASARVTFVETGAANPDTLIVISDPVFGKFSISLPHGKTYDVKVAAAGFGPEAAIRGLTTEGVDDGAPITYADTVYALAMIKGLVALGGGVFMGGVDVLVYDAGGRVAASAKSAADGRYEIRNIPNGVVTVNAGADGYFADAAAIDNNTTIPAPITITINNGRLSPNSDSYNIRLQPGDKAIKFDVAGYSGSGAVKAASPLNRTLFFNNAAGDTAELRNAGAGYYVVEAAPDSSNYSLLELSYHRFNVSQGSAEHTETLYFPFTYPSLDTVASDSAGVCRIAGPTGNPHSPVVKMAFYYRSE
ncbi:MAG: carboxypeptidase-like regulatory domain-containing protein, partial [Chitinispirillales bacterium]|nr:carboxypeptidase-like regulatory domain-containing protein [Chitinispirillales bacterium]